MRHFVAQLEYEERLSKVVSRGQTLTSRDSTSCIMLSKVLCLPFHLYIADRISSALSYVGTYITVEEAVAL
jgi:flagellar biosynthesis protein FlhB